MRDRHSLRFLSLLLCIFSTFSSVVSETKEEHRAECQMWSHLENKTLPLQDDGHANCVTNTDCTGFSCDGLFKGSAVAFGMRVHQCQEPPGLEIYGNAPQFLETNFSHIFQDGAKYQVPPAILNLPNISGLPELPFAGGQMPGVNLYFKVNLEPNNVNLTFNTLRIGLEIQACVNHSAMALNAKVRTSKDLEGEEVCILNKKLFDDAVIPVPHCHQKYPAQPIVGDYCNINDLFGCGDHQTCIQENTEDTSNPEGVCECQTEYTMNPDKSCGPRVRTKQRSGRANEPGEGPQPQVAAEESSTSSVVAGVVSTMLVIVLILVAILLVNRFRLVPRLQAKLKNKPYEDIVINESVTRLP